MSVSTLERTRLRDFAFAAADLLVSTDASGRIIDADGDATLFHPTADRLIGRNAVDLVSEAEGSRLREELWSLGPGRSLSWDDATSIEGGRRIIVQRSSNAPTASTSPSHACHRPCACEATAWTRSWRNASATR
jgi:hypothetical protein